MNLVTPPENPDPAKENWTVIFGPPGCGKTAGLLKILEREIRSGIESERIAFVSFTRAARTEALTRVRKTLGLDTEALPWFRTIHSSAYRLLGLNRDRIMSRRAWKDFVEKHHYQLTDPHDWDEDASGAALEPPQRTKDDLLRYVLEWSKNRRLDLEQGLARCPVVVNAEHFRLFAERVDAFKRERGLLDFTDMLEEALKRRVSPDVDVAFIDEAQDLSPLQIAVVEQWFADCARVYVAGDEDQAVYGFQGADPGWLLSLSERCVRVILNQSYRVPILAHRVAQEIIHKNRWRVAKEYAPTQNPGTDERLSLRQALDRIDERASTLVLARNRLFLAPAAQTLLERRVSYLVEGAGGVSPMSSPSAVRAVRIAHQIFQGASVSGDDLCALLTWIPSRGTDLLPHGVKTRALEVNRQVDPAWLRSELNLGVLLDAIARDGPASVLLKLQPVARDYFKGLLAKYGAIPEPCVRLTTIHAAKGREADLVVVIPDMTRTSYLEYLDGKNGGAEAENRVAYVAVTRTRDRLVIVQPSTRRYYPYPPAAHASLGTKCQRK